MASYHYTAAGRSKLPHGNSRAVDVARARRAGVAVGRRRIYFSACAASRDIDSAADYRLPDDVAEGQVLARFRFAFGFWSDYVDRSRLAVRCCRCELASLMRFSVARESAASVRCCRSLAMPLR